MLLFTFFCLFTSSVLAVDYGNHIRQPVKVTKNYAVSVLSTDYSDDNSRQLMINDANLIFNFEQIRKDQPPQIEQREENIGKYLNGRPKFTTTTTTPRYDKILQEIEPLPRLPILSPPVGIYKPHYQQDYLSAYPSTIPPAPTTPEWTDLSVILSKKTPLHHQQTHIIPEMANDDLNRQSHYLPHHPRFFTTPPFKTSFQDRNMKQILPSYHSIQMFENHDATSTTILPANAQMSHKVKQKPVHTSEALRPTASRGNHKFSWDDIITSKITTTNSLSTIGRQNYSSPPPVATLSPWFDGYKK